MASAVFALEKELTQEKSQVLERHRGKNMTQDPIADFLVRLKNASMAEKREVSVRTSKIVRRIADILKDRGYISEVKLTEGILEVKINLDQPFNFIKRISKPGVRYYAGSKELGRKINGTSTIIVTTSKGILTIEQARKQKVGGELVAEIW